MERYFEQQPMINLEAFDTIVKQSQRTEHDRSRLETSGDALLPVTLDPAIKQMLFANAQKHSRRQKSQSKSRNNSLSCFSRMIFIEEIDLRLFTPLSTERNASMDSTSSQYTYGRPAPMRGQLLRSQQSSLCYSHHPHDDSRACQTP